MRSLAGIGGATLLAALLCACGWGHSVRMLKDSRPFARRQSLTVAVTVPAGKIRLERAVPTKVYELQFSYCRNHFEAESLFREGGAGDSGGEGDRLQVSARQILSTPLSDDEPNLMVLRLRSGLPLDLRLTAGRGEVEADLTALSVKRLVVHGGSGALHLVFKAGNPVDLEEFRLVSGTGAVRAEGLGWGSVTSFQFYGGAGSATIDYSGPGPREAAAFVDPGAGGLEMALPKDLGVEISGKGVDPEMPPPGFLRGKRAWVSQNHETAERHLSVVMDRGSERLRFRWLP